MSGPGPAASCWFGVSVVLLSLSGMIHCGATFMEVSIIGIVSSVHAVRPPESRTQEPTCCWPGSNNSLTVLIGLFNSPSVYSH